MQTTTTETLTERVSGAAVSTPQATHVADGEGERVWFLDNLITVKHRTADAASFSVVENHFPAGSHTPFHRHDDEDEAFYVLAGALRVFLGEGRTVDVAPGGYLHIPRGVAHGFRALAETRMLVIAGARGFVEMAREAGMPAQRAELPAVVSKDLARLEAACERNRIALLGPLPE